MFTHFKKLILHGINCDKRALISCFETMTMQEIAYYVRSSRPKIEPKPHQIKFRTFTAYCILNIGFSKQTSVTIHPFFHDFNWKAISIPVYILIRTIQISSQINASNNCLYFFLILTTQRMLQENSQHIQNIQ